MKLEDIPKEELQDEAKFIAAVVAGLKQQPEGDDRLSLRREDQGHPQRV